MIYQLDAIEYLFVFFQLDMFRAYTPIFRMGVLNCIKMVNHFIFQTKMQGKTTQNDRLLFIIDFKIWIRYCAAVFCTKCNCIILRLTF